ncbi:VanZ family protein [Metabacillus litoralis]|uniref:VanZ family protein n=1 Tax=Metabacillus litoralis TaxID=152268 RepID=UPI000EF566EB|nr:VanZ family protein [Metabacillus litoralis]
MFYFSDINLYLPIILQVAVNMIVAVVVLMLLLKPTKLKNIFDWFVGLCFSLYFCVLYHNTVGNLFFIEDIKYSLENIGYIFYSVNLIPIKGIIDVLRYNPSSLFQIIGNIIMLAPFAFVMLYFKWTSSYKKVIYYSFLCTTGIEFIQFIQNTLLLILNLGIGRSADIDDVILNTLGGFIGIICYVFWRKLEEFLNYRKKIHLDICRNKYSTY